MGRINKQKAYCLFILAALVIVFIIAANKRNEPNKTIQNNISSGEEDEMDKMIKRLGDKMLTLLTKASREYPVPYVRKELTDVLNALEFNQFNFKIAIIDDKDGEDNFNAALQYEENRRPYILFSFKSISQGIADLAKRLGKSHGKLFDSLLTDWYVVLVTREWYYHKLNRSYCDKNNMDIFDAPDLRMRQESEVWMTTLSKVVEPAIQQKRFSEPLDIEITMGVFCYLSSCKDANHQHWQEFIKWIIGDGSVDGLNICLPKSAE